MKDKNIYKAPKSELVDQRSDRKRPPATMIILTPLVIFFNVLASLVIGADNHIEDMDLFLYMLVMAGGVPVLITFIIQQIDKFKNAKARLNILFFVSLVIGLIQLAGLLA